MAKRSKKRHRPARCTSPSPLAAVGIHHYQPAAYADNLPRDPYLRHAVLACRNGPRPLADQCSTWNNARYDACSTWNTDPDVQPGEDLSAQEPAKPPAPEDIGPRGTSNPKDDAMTPPKDRPRLGRGISSLMSPTTPPASDQAQQASASPALSAPTELPVDRIQPNPHQPRRQFNEASLSALADSMKAAGVIQPVVVRQVGDTYELIAGERRLRAAKLAGLATIPALVRETDAITQAQLALIENIQREDLNPIDRAEGYRVLIDQLGLTQAELATRMGEDRSSIANYLRLLDLHQSVRQLLRDGRLSVGHAKVLITIHDPAEQARLADLAVKQDLSVRNLERVVSHGPSASAARPTRPATSAHIQDLEKSLARELGMRVNLRAHPRSKGKGRLVIHYASLDQFDTLLSRLGVNVEQ